MTKIAISGERPCFVYAVYMPDNCDPGPVKVGISHNPANRISGFQTSSPFRLLWTRPHRLPDRATALYVEREFHKRNINRHLSGEWVSTWILGASIEIDEIIIGMLLKRGLGMDGLQAWCDYVGIGGLEDILTSNGSGISDGLMEPALCQ